MTKTLSTLALALGLTFGFAFGLAITPDKASALSTAGEQCGNFPAAAPMGSEKRNRWWDCHKDATGKAFSQSTAIRRTCGVNADRACGAETHNRYRELRFSYKAARKACGSRDCKKQEAREFNRNFPASR